MKTRAYVAVALVVGQFALAGCGSSTPVVDPSTVVTPTVTTETLSGTLSCCLTSDFKTVTVAQSGNLIDFALSALSVNGSPSTISMQLGIGVPTGTTCTLLTGGAITGPAGVPGTLGIAELSGGIQAGTYCLQVTDVGNVPTNATVNYTITVSHT